MSLLLDQPIAGLMASSESVCNFYLVMHHRITDRKLVIAYFIIFLINPILQTFFGYRPNNYNTIHLCQKQRSQHASNFFIPYFISYSFS